MNEILHVIKHEFIHMVKTKGFVIITLIFPLLALAVLGGYQLIQRIDTQDTTTEIVSIGYVDEAGGFDDISQTVEIALMRYQSPEEATEALIAGDIEEYFVIFF